MEAKTKIRVFTAFSGYDSQCLALNELQEEYPDEFQYEIVGWSEIDANAIKAHNILFPEATDKNYGDISKIDWTSVPDFDLFTYSSPCQDFSLAGKQQGAEEGSGTRSSLLWECRRCIEEKRPKYLILENVSALVSKKFFPLFEKWIKTVASYGYESFWQVLNARHYAVPQNRERVFLVSILKENDEKIDYNFPNPIESNCTIEDILEDTADEVYYINQEKVDEWTIDNEKRIREYIAERNGLSEDDLEFERQTANSSVQLENDNVTTMTNITQEPVPEEIQDSSTELYKKRRKKAKTPTRGGHMVLQIPTPTTSSGSAPTLMATGYGSADYKNFYSVGHFPKLGILEVWSDGSDIVVDYTHETKSHQLI